MAIVDRECVVRAGEEAIRLIQVARQRAKIYPAHHPAVTELVLELVSALEEVTEARPTASFNIAHGEVFLDEIPLTSATMTQGEFVEMCTRQAISTLTFRAGVTPEEVTKLIVLLNERAPGTVGEQKVTFQERLAEEGVEHIEAGALVSLAELNLLTQFSTPEEQAARSNYDLVLNTVWEAFQNVRAGKAIDVDTVEVVVNGMIRGLMVDRKVYRRLANIKDYHNYTFNHAVNVAILSALVGTDIGLSTDQLNELGVAALLHDVGKLAVPRDILSKPDTLSPQEWEIMRRHPIEGAQILLGQCGLQDIAVTVALEHHARYDLSGYPRIAAGRRTHLFSSIVGLSDVYDALTSDRSYRRSMMPDTAAAMIMSRSGKDFDPALTKLFVRSVGIYPQDSVVILTNGEPAVVCEPNPGDPLRPKVQLTSGRDEIVDLSKMDVEVTRCVDTAMSILSS